jgi:hypothetical protein
MQDVLRLGRFSHEPAGLGDLWSARIGIVCYSESALAAYGFPDRSHEPAGLGDLWPLH